MRKLFVVLFIMMGVSLFAEMVPGQRVTLNIYQNNLYLRGYEDGKDVPKDVCDALKKFGYPEDVIKSGIGANLYRVTSNDGLFVVVVTSIHLDSFPRTISEGHFLHKKTIILRYLFTDKRGIMYFDL